LQQQNGTLQNSGSQTVGRDVLGTRGTAPGEAAKTVKIEKKRLKIPIFFVRSARAAIKSKYRSKINVEKAVHVAASKTLPR
jgi:hypothetical protein